MFVASAFQIIIFTILTFNLFAHSVNITTAPKIKILKQPFLASNIEQLNQIEWTMLGRTVSETIYCVSEDPVTELRFVCPECVEKNFTDIINTLKSAEDLTKMSGFPAISLQNVPAKANWTGINILCQGKANNKTFNSLPAKIIIQYIRQPYIVDGNNMRPDLTTKQGYSFYVDCLKSQDGKCQEFSTSKNILKCEVEAYPEPTTFKWYKNGIEIPENTSTIEFDVDVIGQSIQCAANNNLHRENNILESQAVQIYPFISPKVLQDNFKALQVSKLYQPGNRININQTIVLDCIVEGNPKPKIFWKHRKLNGELIDVTCLDDINYSENVMYINNAVRVKSSCRLRMSDYTFSGQYWCSGCSDESKNPSKCSSNLNEITKNLFDMNIQGPPIISEQNLSTEKINNGRDVLIRVNYCSNPKPLLSKEVTFVVDQHIIEEGQIWKNINFVSIEQSPTMSICYTANLIIYSDKNFDTIMEIKLIVRNTFGKIDINIPLNFNFSKNNYIALYKSATLGTVVCVILLLISLTVLIYIKNWILKNKKNKVNENNIQNNSGEESQNKKEKDIISESVKFQSFIESNIDDTLNLPMIDETLIYNDYVDFKIYGTLKKQSVYLSQEAFV